MDDNNIVINMPFDEKDGSTTAYDYSINRADGTVVNAQFVVGKSGNCIKFDGNGSCTIPGSSTPSSVNLGNDFSLLYWFNRGDFPDGITAKRVGVLGHYSNGDIVEEWFSVPANTWTYWAIVKEGSNIKVYIDTSLVATLAGPSSNLVGISLNQDLYTTQAEEDADGNATDIDVGAYGMLEDFVYYDVALTEEEISSTLTNETNPIITATIDGVDLQTFGCKVQTYGGIFDTPELKESQSVDMNYLNGVIKDLKDRTFKEREIKLGCFIKANGATEFQQRVNALNALLATDGTHRLMFDTSPMRPLVYEVYMDGKIDVRKKIRKNDVMIGTFTLTLKEPQPIKRVLRHQSALENTVSVYLKTPLPLSIFWGDGTVTEDIDGDYSSTPITHTYDTSSVFYIIIAGVIDKIDNFGTNAIVVWSKI